MLDLFLVQELKMGAIEMEIIADGILLTIIGLVLLVAICNR